MLGNFWWGERPREPVFANGHFETPAREDARPPFLSKPIFTLCNLCFICAHLWLNF